MCCEGAEEEEQKQVVLEGFDEREGWGGWNLGKRKKVLLETDLEHGWERGSLGEKRRKGLERDMEFLGILPSLRKVRIDKFGVGWGGVG